jgi:hypothetical protein
MRHETKIIGFAPKLVPLVRDGSKILTYRLGEKFDFLTIGDTIQVENSSTGTIFGEVEIVEKTHTTFADLPLNREGHEVYPSKEKQREVFAGYYGRKPEDTDKVIILGFKLIKKYE